ncbi:unnamed protein product [Cuscuta campestris]|uniref:Expansin-like EG45 domain-containing protein n=1 Tax=Cuscuta campestris TaxID=132261 RepID=A0A484MRU3_9ASTE|nr:unnamed protein product [Cuscuta campestris]
MGCDQHSFLCAAVAILLAVCTAGSISSASEATCDGCFHHARVSLFSNASALNSGACGYGSMAVGFYGGRIAAASPKLYKDGAACGACFQLRCKDHIVCKKEGTTVMVTDYYVNANAQTHFVISSRALMAMAAADAAGNSKKDQQQRQHLFDTLLDHVEYQRVPCDEYKSRNLAIRVDESSQKPNRLAIQFLYQAGQTEIVSVDVAAAAASGRRQVGSPNWMYMSRRKQLQGGGAAAIWETVGAPPPSGALQFRFVVTAGYDGKWYWANKKVLPWDWKNGGIYDTGLQVTDIALDGGSGCSQTCDDHHHHHAAGHH